MNGHFAVWLQMPFVNTHCLGGEQVYWNRISAKRIQDEKVERLRSLFFQLQSSIAKN